MSRNLSVDAFIRKWRAVELKERSAAQEHFIELCHVLGEPTPAEADPTGESYCFERGATKTTGGEGSDLAMIVRKILLEIEKRRGMALEPLAKGTQFGSNPPSCGLDGSLS